MQQKVTLLVLALLISISLFAQQSPSTSTGKYHYKNFWSHVEKTDEKSLENARYSLETLKKRNLTIMPPSWIKPWQNLK